MKKVGQLGIFVSATDPSIDLVQDMGGSG